MFLAITMCLVLSPILLQSVGDPGNNHPSCSAMKKEQCGAMNGVRCFYDWSINQCQSCLKVCNNPMNKQAQRVCEDNCPGFHESGLPETTTGPDRGTASPDWSTASPASNNMAPARDAPAASNLEYIAFAVIGIPVLGIVFYRCHKRRFGSYKCHSAKYIRGQDPHEGIVLTSLN